MNFIIKLIKNFLRKQGKKRFFLDPKYIIPSSEHHVAKEDISNNALKVCTRLDKAGFQGLVVGGSVRDLLVRKTPKDFDIATDATPNDIRKLFRNARIIGRRFKLAHILYSRDIIEVATFRGGSTSDAEQTINDHGMLIRDNVFGTLEEDAWRRDFTINALYYRPSDAAIIDFTGGYEDIQQQQIRMIGTPHERYQEDPVRMLRAIRFAAKLNFSLSLDTEAPIVSLSNLITHVSGSRLFEEVTKLYQCGQAESAHALLLKYQLFPKLLPLTSSFLDSDHPISEFIITALKSTDARIQENKPVTPAFLFAVFLWFPYLEQSKHIELSDDLPPSIARAKAASRIISQQNKHVTIPKRFTAAIREIWSLQFQLEKRTEKHVYSALDHPRFRAAYDFLAIRALIGDVPIELANWWTTFQEVSPLQRDKMLRKLTKRRTKPAKTASGSEATP